jgi:arginine/ornithine transport system permease protein
MSFILDVAPLYLQGLLTTLALLLGALSVGLLGAVPLAVVRAYGRRRWSLPIAGLTWLFRGTPLLVQLFLLYYGLAQFEWVRESVAWPLLSRAWFCAGLAFALNTCAYTTEILAGALRSVPVGEVDAAYSLGLSPAQVVYRICLPSALRRSLPSYSNEVIFMLHGTSLASVVTLLDITGAAREVYARTYQPFEAFALAALLYGLLTLALLAVFRWAERRFLAHLRPVP